jgi:hemerythrin-like domain-containing protein
VTVNTQDMLLLHGVYRREFADISRLVESVPESDLARARIVGDHITFMLSALHHHHAAEDDHVWPILQLRVTRSKADIQRMMDEHSAIATAVQRVETLLVPWRTSADRGSARLLASAATGLAALVNEHLDDEERVALPLIEQYLRADEWQAMLDQAATFINVRNLRLGIVMGGMVLGAASDEERRVLLASLPAPQRFMIRLFGARAAAAYRKRLEGR